MSRKRHLIYLTGLLCLWYAIVCSSYSNAQSTWSHIYGQPGAYYQVYSAEQTSDGGFIAAGEIYNFSTEKGGMWIVKSDSSGNIIWQKTYHLSGYESVQSIHQTSDGGYIAAGYVTALASMDILILKLDSSGNIIWQKIYGGSFEDSANSVQQTSDGGYIVAGSISSFGINNQDIWILKLDASGDVTWQKIFEISTEFNNGYSVQQTSDGGYVVAGTAYFFGTGTFAGLIIKLDSSGSLIWQKRYGYFYNSSEYAQSIQQTSDGGYIVAGNAEYDYGGTFLWIMKLDASGNESWQKIYNGSDNDWLVSIQQTSDGGYIVAEYAYNSSAGDLDYGILKLDASGDIVWQKTYGGSSNEDPHSIQQTSDGGYIMAGYTSSFGVGTDFWILKLDASGNITWQKAYGGSNTEIAYSIQQTGDGGYIVAGITDSFNNVTLDILVIKLDSNGAITWQKTYGSSTMEEYAKYIQQTSDGGYIIGGIVHSYEPSNIQDFWILKLDESGNSIWQKTYGGSASDEFSSIKQTTDSGFIVAGYTASFGFNTQVGWLLKLNPYGTMNSSCDFIKDTAITPVDSAVSSTDTNAIVGSGSTTSSSGGILFVDINVTDFLLCAAEIFLKPYNNEKPVVIDSGSSTINGIIEPDEIIELQGTLENTGSTSATAVTGSLTSADPITILTANASYPDIFSLEHETCTACYSISAPLSSRPATHWDFTVTENVSAVNFSPRPFSYSYHVGASFSDVPPSYLFYPFIEKILHAGVTSGCTSTLYCPANKVKRDQMAKFICNSMQASQPGVCSNDGCYGFFNDVPYDNVFCPYIEQLYAFGIISGCQSYPLLFCPELNVQRQSIAKLVCLSMQSIDPGSCVTEDCTGIFTDVPASNPFCSFIEALYNAGIVSGCGANTYCPASEVTRGQMSKFLVNAFSLGL